MPYTTWKRIKKRPGHEQLSQDTVKWNENVLKLKSDGKAITSRNHSRISDSGKQTRCLQKETRFLTPEQDELHPQQRFTLEPNWCARAKPSGQSLLRCRRPCQELPAPTHQLQTLHVIKVSIHPSLRGAGSAPPWHSSTRTPSGPSQDMGCPPTEFLPSQQLRNHLRSLAEAESPAQALHALGNKSTFCGVPPCPSVHPESSSFAGRSVTAQSRGKQRQSRDAPGTARPHHTPSTGQP